MKKVFQKFLYLCICLVSIHLQAQDVKLPQPLLEKMSKETCDCIKKLDQKATDLETQVASCVQQSMMGHMSEMGEVIDLSKMNEDIGRKMGMQLASQLAKTCPEFIEISMKVAETKGGNSTSKVIVEVPPPIERIFSGKIKRLDNLDFTYFVVEGEDKKENSFVWLSRFETSDKFLAGIDKYKGTKVRVNYMEQEVYSFKTKNYIKVKEVKSLSFE
ncbi:MAG: hypothetical protein H7Y04_05020 [Verrucomicrobia bacterium]|nr:hypothetical protein [Cytophagales bacterium]